MCEARLKSLTDIVTCLYFQEDELTEETESHKTYNQQVKQSYKCPLTVTHYTTAIRDVQTN